MPFVWAQMRSHITNRIPIRRFAGDFWRRHPVNAVDALGTGEKRRHSAVQTDAIETKRFKERKLKEGEIKIAHSLI